MDDDPVAALKRRLQASGKVYEALQPLGGGAARVRFDGPFRGRQVVWEASLITLRDYLRCCGGKLPMTRQFIEVGEVGAGLGWVKIGLNVPAIDEPTVLKSMLMLRQWRRLGPGRHEFGAFRTAGEPDGKPSI